MNVKLTRIAESKVRQLGGDVCGVLVRKGEKLAAVDEHGQVACLGDEALIDSIKQRADAWLGLVELLNDLTPEWRQHPGTGRESAFAAIRGLAQAARAQGGQVEETCLPPFDPSKPRDEQGLYGKFLVRRVDGSDLPGGKHHGCKYFVLDVDHDKYAAAALGIYASQCEQEYPLLAKDLRERFGAQGGQGADAVKWSDPAVDPIVSKLYRKFKEWNRQGFGADDVTWCEVRGYVAELLNAQPQPAVPECQYPCGWDNLFKIIVENAANFARSTLDDEVSESVRQMGIDSGQYAIHLCKLARSLSTPTTPQADGQIPDWLYDGYAVYQNLTDEQKAQTSAKNVSDTLDAIVAMLKRPQPPKEGA